jgi:hypothetical protein
MHDIHAGGRNPVYPDSICSYFIRAATDIENPRPGMLREKIPRNIRPEKQTHLAIPLFGLLNGIRAIQDGRRMQTPMDHRVARRFIVILRCEWLRELTCKQVISNKERIATCELASDEAVSELAT